MKNDNQKNGGLIAGTLIVTDKGKVPIEEIKVGDKVLSKPENGEGEASFKPVLETVVYEDRPIWLVKAKKIWEFEDKDGNDLDEAVINEFFKSTEFLVTPNHPIWVVGKCEDEYGLNTELYEQPHWKRIDELMRYEIAVNADGVMYTVINAQPTYKFADKVSEGIVNENYYWYQENYHEDFNDYLNNSEQKPDFDLTEVEYKADGYVFDVRDYQADGLLGTYVKSKSGMLYFNNRLVDDNGDYIPFTHRVYNFEVAENHTYFVDDARLWVHNCDLSTIND